ncbi:MAG: FAD-dependent oxidoreductase [Variovorax sp.]|nr:FAD-dependent oxidoreductase [Variovorax sp.]
MRVVVLGAGLHGVTTAYYLQQLGHEVIVIDRHDTPAAKARGRVPRAEDGAPSASRAASQTARPLRGRWSRLRSAMRAQFGKLRKAIDSAVAPPRSHPLDHMVRLAVYSRENARALRDESGLQARQRSNGQMTVYTDAEAFRRRIARAPHWSELGCEDRLLSVDEAVEMEPSLALMGHQLVGATHSHDDPARDPSQFAASIVFLCRAAGVRFMTRHTVVSLKERDGRVDHVELLDPSGQPTLLRAQSYVLALGASSAMHAEHLGIEMSLDFVREYIVTLPILDADRAPGVSLHDRQGRLRVRRVESALGPRLRVSSTVRVRDDGEHEPDSDRFEAMLRRVELLFPGAADIRRATFDTAMHAVSSNRLPMIGKTRLPNLFLNTAPGTPGWTNALGAGKSIARIVSGLRPELDFAFRGL